MNPPETILVDVSHASSKQSLHEIFAATFQFPSYYGKNWDAFNDCIGDPDQSRMPRHVIILGFKDLEKRLQAEAVHLRSCFSQYQLENPDGFKVRYEDRQLP
jgi:ribonuclease inhibitor